MRSQRPIKGFRPGKEPAHLVANAQQWISEQREVHRSAATPISAEEQSQLRSFFRETTLDRARIRGVPVIQNPAFYAELDQVPLDFATMAAITFDDTILVSSSQVPGPAPIGLVFHELVHVVQYDVLGVPADRAV